MLHFSTCHIPMNLKAHAPVNLCNVVRITGYHWSRTLCHSATIGIVWALILWLARNYALPLSLIDLLPIAGQHWQTTCDQTRSLRYVYESKHFIWGIVREKSSIRRQLSTSTYYRPRTYRLSTTTWTVQACTHWRYHDHVLTLRSSIRSTSCLANCVETYKIA